jgi:hypothetical protein
VAVATDSLCASRFVILLRSAARTDKISDLNVASISLKPTSSGCTANSRLSNPFLTDGSRPGRWYASRRPKVSLGTDPRVDGHPSRCGCGYPISRTQSVYRVYFFARKSRTPHRFERSKTWHSGEIINDSWMGPCLSLRRGLTICAKQFRRPLRSAQSAVPAGARVLIATASALEPRHFSVRG